jgi:hypothetical protein
MPDGERKITIIEKKKGGAENKICFFPKTNTP